MPNRLRLLLAPGLLTLAMLAALVSLGDWQLRRLTWKEGILADIDRGEAAPAQTLPPAPAPFTKVRVEGVLRDDLAAQYGSEVRATPAGEEIGAYLINPLERPGAEPIIVDRGWVPTSAPHATTPGTGPVTLEGYVRQPEYPVLFGARDDPAQRRFFALDPAAIGASLGFARVAPFTLVVLGRPAPGVFPQPATELPRPPNNHLSYALTWFGLAGCLLVVFAAWSRRALLA